MTTTEHILDQAAASTVATLYRAYLRAATEKHADYDPYWATLARAYRCAAWDAAQTLASARRIAAGITR